MMDKTETGVGRAKGLIRKGRRRRQLKAKESLEDERLGGDEAADGAARVAESAAPEGEKATDAASGPAAAADPAAGAKGDRAHRADRAGLAEAAGAQPAAALDGESSASCGSDGEDGRNRAARREPDGSEPQAGCGGSASAPAASERPAFKPVLSAGAQDVTEDRAAATLVCPSCGSSIKIDAKTAADALCPWCRNRLPWTGKLPSGVAPDLILPFAVDRQTAFRKMRYCVSDRRFYAHWGFRKGFSEQGLRKVFLPYMLVDVKAAVTASGKGQKTTVREKWRMRGEDGRFYDMERFSYVKRKFVRKFDILIKDLPIEASRSRFDPFSPLNAVNAINAVLPYDSENCAPFNPALLRGGEVEPRDMNVSEMRPRAVALAQRIARSKAWDLHDCDRGAVLKSMAFEIREESWRSAYFPVWLYSCSAKSLWGKNMTFCVAVNGRSGETEGCVPLNKPLLGTVTALTALPFLSLLALSSWADHWIWGSLFLCLAVLGARHALRVRKLYHNRSVANHYGRDTRCEVENLSGSDKDGWFSHRTYDSRMSGADSFD